jgi:hypothetical protein
MSVAFGAHTISGSLIDIICDKFDIFCDINRRYRG